MLKPFPSDKISGTKHDLFSVSQAPTHDNLTFNSYISCSTRYFSLKLCVEFFVFHFILFLIKVHIFVQQNK